MKMSPAAKAWRTIKHRDIDRSAAARKAHVTRKAKHGKSLGGIK
jgi:hypothetical protein